jgi:5,10-methylenetetrahydrofolate reductase
MSGALPKKVLEGGAIILELPVAGDLLGDRAVEYAERLKEKVDGFLIPDLPTDRLSIDGLSLSYLLVKAGIDELILAQATSRRDELANLARLLGAWRIGIRAVFIVQGDVRMSNVKASRIISLLSSMREGRLALGGKDVKLMDKVEFFIGSVLSPSRKGEEGRLERKLKAGADFFLTQLCLSKDDLMNFLEKVDLRKPLGVSFPILYKAENLERLKVLDGINIPEKVYLRLKTSKDLVKDSVDLSLEIYDLVKDRFGKRSPISVYLVPLSRNLELEDVLNRFK